ncbi:MAG: hypothetical protein Q9174_004477 [Haloplaca sp. 1 TL-2023]
MFSSERRSATLGRLSDTLPTPAVPCERNNASCEYYDSAKEKTISRNYVIYLQQKIKALEEESSLLDSQATPFRDIESMVRSGGLVTLKENTETRYLGPSSGIAMTRLVMEFAKTQTQSASIQNIVSDNKARRDRFTQESAKPTSKVYPLISSVAAPDLPSRDLTDKLVDLFNRKAQFMLPTLHEPSFRRIVDNVYRGSLDAYENFVVRIVLAVSMQKLDAQYAGLADSYYLAAMPFLEESIQRKDVGTLQCLALIAQYSMITPTRAASYWVVGLASKLCQELGFTEEASITRPDVRTGGLPNALEIDMRRRLQWIIFSMETGLAHSLGRPSSFACSYDHVDVQFFEPVDDEYISSKGIVPGCPRSMKKRVAIHFLSMRYLQLEIRRALYLRKREHPQSNDDPWFSAMERKLRDWLQSCPKQDGGSGLDEVWFKGRFNTMIVFLYRPSPQVPHPSLEAARACFEASTFNVRMHRNQVATKSVDLSWIWTQSAFMALNTILWALSYPEIRREHSRAIVENHIMQAQECISAASERWPGVEAAIELYDVLVAACLKAYDATGIPAATASNQETAAPIKLERYESQLSASSPSTMISSSGSPRPSDVAASPLSSTLATPPAPPPFATSVSSVSQSFDRDMSGQYILHDTMPSRKPISFDPAQMNPVYEPNPGNATIQQIPFPVFPAFHDTNQLKSLQSHDESAMPLANYDQYFAMMGDPYFQYFQAPDLYQPAMPSLNQEQQVELMRNLESDSATYSWRFP